MKTASTRPALYPPVAIVVDDDPMIVRRLGRKFLSETSMGVLCAETLSQAAMFMEDKRLTINAIVADLGFRGEAHDDVRQLVDGIDLLAFAAKTRPGLPQYVISVWADEAAERKRAEKLGLHIAGWYQKLNEGNTRLDASWVCIERDLIKRAIAGDTSRKERVRALGIKEPAEELSPGYVSEIFRGSFEAYRLTYLQILPAPYVVERPIEVVCVKDGGDIYHANAYRLGLLAEGVGDSADEAVTVLGEKIADEMRVFGEEPTAKLVGYAKLISRRMAEHIRTEK